MDSMSGSLYKSEMQYYNPQTMKTYLSHPVDSMCDLLWLWLRAHNSTCANEKPGQAILILYQEQLPPYFYQVSEKSNEWIKF